MGTRVVTLKSNIGPPPIAAVDKSADAGPIDFDCGRFPAGDRRRTVCDGASELPEEIRRKYLKHWAGLPQDESWKLGDQASAALARIGITKDRVERWLGRPCGCAERQEKLNRFGDWMKSLVSRTPAEQREDLDKLIE